MNRFDASISLKGLFSGDARKPTVILILGSLLLLTSKYYGTKAFYIENLSSTLVWFNNPALTAEYYVFLSSFVLLAVIPLAIIRFSFREPFSSYGLHTGDWRFGWKAVAVIAPIMIVSAFPSSKMPDFLAEYPLYKGAGNSASDFVAHALAYLVFYVGWEVFFRGFMQFGLRDRFGDWLTILVCAMAAGLWHIGKPAGETYTSILGAIVWGMVAFRTRSILYTLLIHWLLGVSLDFFICFT